MLQTQILMNKFLFSLPVFVITLSADAQSWYPPGATWYPSVYSYLLGL